MQYGELRAASAMARLIVEFREKEAIRTSDQLKKVLKKFLSPKHENKILAQIYFDIEHKLLNPSVTKYQVEELEKEDWSYDPPLVRDCIAFL